MNTIRQEWEYTYKSARWGGYSRRQALRKFVREVAVGLLLDAGLHPKYRRDGSAR